MTETGIKLSNDDTCAFSQVEAEVLRRVSAGSTITSISSELGLAEPIVKEYIKSLLRKVRMRDVERTSGLGVIEEILRQKLFNERLVVSGPRLQSLGGQS
jgi:DNA-binding NarL/FixJ family response regulator